MNCTYSGRRREDKRFTLVLVHHTQKIDSRCDIVLEGNWDKGKKKMERRKIRFEKKKERKKGSKK